jgi:integrase
VSIYKRGKFYWSRIVRNGEVFSRSTKRKNRADALKVDAHWIIQAEQGNVALRRAERVILAQFEKRFFAYIDQNVASPKTRAYYKTHWTPLRESRLGAINMANIGSVDIHQWSIDRAKDVGPSSVNGSLRTLRRALRIAHEWGVLKVIPKIKTVKGEHKREFVIEEALLSTILAHEKCTPVLKDLIPFLIDTGLRLGEAMSLQWKSVDLKNLPGSVFIEKGKTKNARRTVYLTDRARGILERRKSADKDAKGTVFEYSPFTVGHQFTVLRDAMELGSDCVLHSCRHTFCTRLGTKGTSAFQIMRLAGHANVSVSQRYVHEDADSQKAAIASLNG